MMRPRILPPRLRWVHRIPILANVLLALAVSGCAGRTHNPTRGSDAFVVYFSATRTADHTALVSASVPVTLGGQGKVETASKTAAENQPALPEFSARLKSRKPLGVYELVTRATVREAIRNKKGKLKVSQRYLGALVPTHLGETQVVSADADPIHLEARLERR